MLILYIYIYIWVVSAAAKLPQSHLTLCDPIDSSPWGSPVPGILQARTLEWVAISFSNAWKWKVKVKSSPTLSDPMDCSPPGSSIHGTFQARVLQWVPLPSPELFLVWGYYAQFYEHLCTSVLVYTFLLGVYFRKIARLRTCTAWTLGDDVKLFQEQLYQSILLSAV